MRKKRTFLLLDMLMIGNVVFAVAVIAVAPGAVPELQLRIAHICPSANGTPMVVGLGILCGIRTGLRSSKFDRLFLRFLPGVK